MFISLYWVERWAPNLVRLNQRSSKHGPWVRCSRQIVSICPSHQSLEGSGSTCSGSWYSSVSQTTSDPAHHPVQLWTLWVLMRGGSETGSSGIPEAQWNCHGHPSWTILLSGHGRPFHRCFQWRVTCCGSTSYLPCLLTNSWKQDPLETTSFYHILN